MLFRSPASVAASDHHGRALCDAAVTLAESADAAAIVAVTRGGATAYQLAALRPRVPIIAVTALSLPSDRDRCLAAGANAFYSKPVSLQVLEDAIRTHLN